MSELVKLTRRDLLALGIRSSAGLAIGIVRPFSQAPKTAPVTSISPSPLIQIDTKGNITVWAPKLELGQGVHTAFAMIVKDEIGVEFTRIRVVQAPFDPKFGNQETRGSRSIRSMEEPLRGAAAIAREMLLQSAASRWNVPVAECRIERIQAVHLPTKRSIPIANLVATAARLPIPKNVTTARAAGMDLVGRAVGKIDTPARVDGSAKYPIDVRLLGMLYACIARSPVFEAKLASLDDAKARKVKGVKNVLRISSGVAILADSTWAAIQGRNELVARWESTPNADDSSLKLRARMDEASRQPGKTVLGDASAELPAGSKTIESVYDVGFQAHAAMEPISATAKVARGRCEVWASSQDPAWAHAEIKRITGLADSAIRINIMPGGGAFGRAIYPDHIVEAVEVAKAAGVPVKVFRQREDDMQFDRFRPASLHRMSAAIDSGGKPVFWSHHIVTTPILEKSGEPEVHRFETDGAEPPAYRIPGARVAYTPVVSHVPRGCWRSSPHVANAFTVECMIDELAAAAQADPLKYRLESLDSPRLKAVVELAASKAGWGTKLPARQGRGIACHHSFGSYAAGVAEVVVDGDGNVRVSRFVVALDCGRQVNPGVIAAQVEGSVAFGLSAALVSKITIENGKVLESNFHNNPVLKIDQMPAVDLHLIRNEESPGGVGEPVVPVVAPALCNALFAATGVRIRALPVRTRLLRQR